jgi:hypothetical protein
VVILAIFANFEAERTQMAQKNEKSFANVNQNKLYFPILVHISRTIQVIVETKKININR